jgi:hypothetical protein
MATQQADESKGATLASRWLPIRMLLCIDLLSSKMLLFARQEV